MSVTMFIVGFVIFAAYIALTVWSIFYNSRKQQEENYPNLNGMGETIDYDGMGNYGRFPTEKPKKKRLTKSRKKVKL
jgi:hypothetical protein